MRILSVTAQKPHSTGSGVYLTETVCEFLKMGIENAVVAGVYADDTVCFPEQVSFYPVYYETESLPFPICGMSDEMPYVSTLYRSMDDTMIGQFEAAFSAVLEKAVREFKPDVIFCHHLYLLTALVRRQFPDIPVWGMCHGSDLRQLYTNPMRAEQIVDAVSGLDRIFCLHEQQRQQILALFAIPEDRLRVIGAGYNSSVFYDRDIREEHKELRLCYAGKISEKKGIFSLIAALSLLGLQREDFSLRMAGGWSDDGQRERVLECIRQSGWDIRLLGRLSQQALAEEYSKADIFILPSFYEGLPLVLAEALSCGAKVICTDLPGIRQWMDSFVPDNGILFVAPPEMEDADTPVPSSLPRFEAELAAAIKAASLQPRRSRDVTVMSWRGVCERLLK